MLKMYSRLFCQDGVDEQEVIKNDFEVEPFTSLKHEVLTNIVVKTTKNIKNTCEI
jgi:hypothetical protein